MPGATKCYAPVRGSVIRVTRLDACGEPDPGASAVVVSKRVSSVNIDEVSDEGTNIRERNFGDELLFTDDAYSSFIGLTTDTTLCGVDPALVNVFTNQPVALNGAGDIVGFDIVSGINLDEFAFSLEIWSKLAGAQCDPSGNREWGYTVFPFVKGGRLGGFSFENAAVEFQIMGAQTRDGNSWGVGPYDVTRAAGTAGTPGVPSPLFTPLLPNAHMRQIVVNLDPPVASCGAFALTP